MNKKMINESIFLGVSSIMFLQIFLYLKVKEFGYLAIVIYALFLIVSATNIFRGDNE